MEFMGFKTANPKMSVLATTALALFTLMTLVSCDKGGGTFSLLPAGDTFTQTSSSVTNDKIDILFVVDNSGSMQPLQTNMLNNFNSFISNFITKGYDFQIGVTTTDAYLSMPQYDNKPSLAYLRDGVGHTHTGYPIITPTTPNIISTFVTNANQGDQGSGDERAFSSFQVTLQSSNNASFHRPDAFLAIVILSDEDDFSDETRGENSGIDHNYNDPNLDTVASYESFLDSFTGSQSPATRTWNVSAIAVLDSACLASHGHDAPTTIIGQRYIQLANDSDGVLGSVCDTSYADSLNLISDKIIELSTQFALSRVPDPSTIVVTVNGSIVPEDATNGWTYNSSANSIVFHGSAIPPQGSTISVDFQPLTAQN
jgi:hypothetical protein